MIDTIREPYLPFTVSLLTAPGLEELAPFVREQRAIDGKATAYVCQNFACHSPITDPTDLANTIKNPAANT
jgi:uncharacterized protein YyaL (SSP411 family)